MKISANKLMKSMKLSKDERKLYKAKITDEEGTLTEFGKEIVINIVSKDPSVMKEMLEIADVVLEDEKKTD
jgi:hypothetical protein